MKNIVVIAVLVMVVPSSVFGQGDGDIVQATLLHTNDFHGRLEPDYRGRGGAAYLAGAINQIRDAVGDENVVLLDAGDEMFGGPPISELLLGESTIDVFNLMGYDLAVVGHSEFNEGQGVLSDRVAQSEYPWLGANVVVEGTDWENPPWVIPYTTLTVGTPPDQAVLGVIGVATEETPELNPLGVTDGLVFRDLTETILHYYDEVMGLSDALVVVAHMGTDDSGPYEGLVTVAQDLIDAGKPVDLMIGGHHHQALFTPVWVGDTAIVSAGYYGRWLGRLDVSIDTSLKRLSVDDYQLITITAEATIEGLIATLEALYDEGKVANRGILNSLLRKLENARAALDRGQVHVAHNILSAFMNEVEDLAGSQIDADAAAALLEDAGWVVDHTDFEVAERVEDWAETVEPIINEPVGATNIDLLRDYNNESNMGDIVTDSMLWKADSYDDGELNGSVDIAFTNPGGLRFDILIPEGAALPHPVTWGDTYNVLPFGNTLYLMDLTGAQIQTLLDQAASLYKGMLQTSGASWYWYNDCGCDGPTAWGSYGVAVDGEPLDRDGVYRVVTNDFLAGGQDGWVTFAEGTNRWNTYFDMQQGLVEYIQMLEVIDAADIPGGRINQLDHVVTLLHTNDSHGRWEADTYGGGFVYLADLIAKERDHNPNALLFDAGDTFQGNLFAYFFKDRPDNPIAGGMNLLGYDAFTIGNHEFNFGPATFATILGQLEAPILGTINLEDDGSYGFINDNVDDYINLDVDGLKVTVFGLTNPRVYRYELPTNIPGLTFYSAMETGIAAVPDILDYENPDLLVGLTHVGYAPYGGEIDSDLLLAEAVAGIDVLIGGHSHTLLDPAVVVSSEINPEGTLVAQARRYAGYLGKVNVGFVDGDVVLREGYLIPTSSAEPDADMEAYLAPYLAEIDAYSATVIGETDVPIDALDAYTEETNGANLQADGAVFGLQTEEGVVVDLHLSGAMSNRMIAATAPVELTNGDMFTLMPYENSLVVFSLNGPQIKEILERGYRNYWYYTYDSSYGGYSHYTTCMLTTNEGNQITYDDPGPGTPPDGNNVVSLTIDGAPVDFANATTYYLVSTVNYIAAGSCNFNDGGETIWPLDQIMYDTQVYVRDAVIGYVEAHTPISPAIEGRLVFE